MQPAFRRLAMVPDGTGHYQVTIPSFEIIGGTLEYYFEQASPSGQIQNVRNEDGRDYQIPILAFSAAESSSQPAWASVPKIEIIPWYRKRKNQKIMGLTLGSLAAVVAGTMLYLELSEEGPVKVIPDEPLPGSIFIPLPERE
jgi:hypothetical protein